MNTLTEYQIHFLSISLIIFNFQTLMINSQPISSFSLQDFNPDKTHSFNHNFSLLGDAKIISNEGNFVNLTTPLSSISSGQIIYKKPFKFLDSKISLKPTISFSTDFTFTITQGLGDGIAFVIFDEGDFGVFNNMVGNFVAVKFGDKNGNNVGVNVGGKFVKSDSFDVSSIGLVVNGGKPLRTWIDYDSNSKRLEVRLGEIGVEKPYKPLISSAVDLSKMWGDKEVLVGISANSTQVCSLHSWSFSVRSVGSSFLHSQPNNPEGNNVVRGKSCFLTVLGNLIFFTGCGTLVAFVGLFLWVVLFGRNSNVVPELPLNAMEFKYEKVNLDIDDVADDPRS